MNELLEKLQAADQICLQTNEFYQQSAELEGSRDRMKSIASKILKILTFPLCYYLCELIFALIGVHLGGLGLVLSIGLGVTLGIVLNRTLGEALIELMAKPLNKKISALNSSAQEIFEQNMEIMAFLPVDYWYPMATSYLIKIVSTGRCEDLNEALDKYDMQLHRWTLEESHAELLAEQKFQTAQLKSIKRSSRLSAGMSSLNALLNLDRRF